MGERAREKERERAREESTMESWQMAVGTSEPGRLEWGGGSLKVGNLGVRHREREQT